MLWIKNHRLMTLSLLSVFVSFSFCLFGLSSDSYAASQTITCDPNNYYSNCDKVWDSSLLGFTPLYLQIDVVNSDKHNVNSAVATNYFINNQSFNTSIPFSDSGSSSSLIFLPGNKIDMWSWSYFGSSYDSVSFTFYDSWPIVPCECPDCPEIPETPYGDKLDKIYNAIMIAAGTMLVIYFFFAIYSLFFGGLRR